MALHGLKEFDLHEFECKNIPTNSVIGIIGNRESGKTTLAYYLGKRLCQNNKSKIIVLTSSQTSKNQWLTKTYHVYDEKFDEILNQIKDEQQKSSLVDHVTLIIDDINVIFLKTSIILMNLMIMTSRLNMDIIISGQMIPRNLWENMNHWFFTSLRIKEIEKLGIDIVIANELQKNFKNFDILSISINLELSYMQLLPIEENLKIGKIFGFTYNQNVTCENDVEIINSEQNNSCWFSIPSFISKYVKSCF